MFSAFYSVIRSAKRSSRLLSARMASVLVLGASTDFGYQRHLVGDVEQASSLWRARCSATSSRGDRRCGSACCSPASVFQYPGVLVPATLRRVDHQRSFSAARRGSTPAGDHMSMFFRKARRRRSRWRGRLRIRRRSAGGSASAGWAMYFSGRRRCAGGRLQSAPWSTPGQIIPAAGAMDFLHHSSAGAPART